MQRGERNRWVAENSVPPVLILCLAWLRLDFDDSDTANANSVLYQIPDSGRW
jgi:hypothetical protein